MIQFNLLPDIKIEYLKANRQKHLVVLGSILLAGVSITALLALAAITFVVQKKSLSDVSADINTASSQLQSTKDLTKILTVQNQLKALTALHDQKPVATRLFTFLQQATPPQVVNSRVLSDFTLNNLILTGSADTLGNVNAYIDALKGTTFSLSDSPKVLKPAFSDVVLASFGRDSKSATYSITLNFAPDIFSDLNNVTFQIGSIPKNGAGQ